MKPALVLLAAGASERLGQCKALVDLGGRTPLEHLLRAGAECDGALVVTGADHALIAPRVPAGAQVLFHPSWSAGRTSGVIQAASHWPGRDLVLAPVDVPLVPPEVFAALLTAWEAAGAPDMGWLAPRVGRPARYGHPVLVGRGLLQRLAPPDGARPLFELRASARPLLACDVASPRVLDDLDRPEDLERLRRLAAGTA